MLQAPSSTADIPVVSTPATLWPAGPTGGSTLRSGVIRGAIWTLLEHGGGQMLRLIGNLILTRLLFPEAFGLMSLIFTFLTGLEMFSDTGSRVNIIQSRRGDDPAFLNTAWTLQIVRGAALTALAALLAWPATWFYGDARLLYMLPVAGLVNFIGGWNATALVTLTRQLHLKPLVVLNLFAQAAGIAVMVAWAYLYPSVWALLGGALISKAILAGGSHLLPGQQRNRFQWDAAAARDLFHFGKWIFLASAVQFLASQGDRLLVGKYLGMYWLGIYGIAFALVEMVWSVLSKVSHGVLLPAFSHVARNDPGQMSKVYYRARLGLDLVAFPAAGAMIVFGPLLVNLLYDRRYAAAGWMLQILALRLIASVLIPASMHFLAQGKPFYATLNAIGKAMAIFVGVPVGWQVGGLHGVVWAVGLAELIGAIPMVVGLYRQRMLNILAELRGVPLLATGMGLGWLFTLTERWLVSAVAALRAMKGH